MPITTDEHAVHLALSDGTTASVALLGATVYSYVSHGSEHLFKSSKSPITGPKAIRGGIPICWPIFGPPDPEKPLYSKLSQHGFARASVWTYAGGSDEDGKVQAKFALASSESTLAVFGLPFELSYVVSLTATALHVALSVANSGSEPLPFQALLHSYLRLPPSVLAAQTVIPSALKGLTYADKVRDGASFTEENTDVAVDGPGGEVDRVYYASPDTLALATPTASLITVTKRNLSDVVVWNPGEAKSNALADMEPKGFEKYVCIEPGQVGSYVTLSPGQSWTGSVTYAPVF